MSDRDYASEAYNAYALNLHIDSLKAENTRLRRYFQAQHELAEYKRLNCWGNHDGCTRCEGKPVCGRLEGEMKAIAELYGKEEKA